MGLIREIMSFTVPCESVAFWWLGQGSFVFKNPQGKIIFVDPYLSNSVAQSDGPGFERMVPVPVRPEDVRADAVICTHHHEDHTDEGTLPGIASADPYILFWGPSRSIALCRKWKIREDRLRTINRGQNENIADFNVFAHYADHSEDSISLVLISGKTRIAITGDSRYHDRLTTGLKSHAPQVLITVINGKLGNMDPAEAAVLTRELNPCLVIPCHYGMFEKNTVDPQLFVSALTQYGLRERAHIMEQCGRFVYPS